MLARKRTRRCGCWKPAPLQCDLGRPEASRSSFRPNPPHDRLVARRGRTEDETDPLSFAAITDEPPAEVAAARHHRCIIPIKLEYIDAWLNPGPANLAAKRRRREGAKDAEMVCGKATQFLGLFPIDARQLAADDPAMT